MQFMTDRVGLAKVRQMRIVYFKIPTYNIPKILPHRSCGEHVPIQINEFFLSGNS